MAVRTITPSTFATIPMIEVTVPTQGRLSAYWRLRLDAGDHRQRRGDEQDGERVAAALEPGPEDRHDPVGRAAGGRADQQQEQRRVAQRVEQRAIEAVAIAAGDPLDERGQQHLVDPVAERVQAVRGLPRPAVGADRGGRHAEAEHPDRGVVADALGEVPGRELEAEAHDLRHVREGVAQRRPRRPAAPSSGARARRAGRA